TRRGALLEAESAVAAFDFLLAVSELLDDKAWNLPVISERSEFKLEKAWHPLLKVGPVPLDISCGRKFRILVITGPNTGGKTVALKTVALCIILAWFGLPVPAAEASEVGRFSSIFFDIGDEQSIEQNLSTFSGHIITTIDMLHHAEKDSLLLIDEMGSGTDPQEGAALGIAILDVLREKGIMTIATTHHNPIKRFALSSPGIETASMEFDELSLQPTFRLIMGAPGKSNALIIAERLGMPLEVIERARKAMEDEGAFTSRIIDELHDKQLEVQKVAENNILVRRQLDEKEELLSLERQLLENERSDILRSAREEAKDIIKDARTRSLALIKKLEGAALSAAHRKLAEEKALFQNLSEETISMNKKTRKSSGSPKQQEQLLEGMIVQIDNGKNRGTVLSVEGEKATVQVGQIRMEIPRDRLKIVRTAREKEIDRPANTIRIERPVNIPPSLMIRGMTVEESIPLLERYLDQAMRAGYDSVLIIHGRGQGVLRKEVHSICNRLPYVSEFRLGNAGEGGHGVTVVTFKK
ncbi:MAG: Smr/MutS family protein, partial [Synergistales bacterium]|nr:Smr/MutS family protein [Synergistales bacterium]